ncbi:MAG: phosphate ABC transporter substrate-binding protein [Pseudomonadota bacterium]|nr:phosphate ABC transporter substrate-binding protein [Pseudomonadota bacterium]
MKKVLIKTTLLLMALLSLQSKAEVVIIVNKDNQAILRKKEIKDLYLGRIIFFPNGRAATAYNKPESDDTRIEFQRLYLNKDKNEIKSYWSKLIFTGKGAPPQTLLNDQDVISMVNSNINAIGYIDSKSLDDSVRTIIPR